MNFSSKGYISWRRWWIFTNLIVKSITSILNKYLAVVYDRQEKKYGCSIFCLWLCGIYDFAQVHLVELQIRCTGTRGRGKALLLKTGAHKKRKVHYPSNGSANDTLYCSYHGHLNVNRSRTYVSFTVNLYVKMTWLLSITEPIGQKVP